MKPTLILTFLKETQEKCINQVNLIVQDWINQKKTMLSQLPEWSFSTLAKVDMAKNAMYLQIQICQS